ncbi:ABC transporter permease subunit [Paracoccus suum]|uniref:ABC transporter permease subunit n=2 Tax=Paracoccus suum TaxID=2259340 RepID=A0A344PP12_9RHOB|nr:ABC transporter permease subunit [Paracoccus suum]
MLINDRRYRGYTIQVVVFILIMAAAWWLIGNTIENLSRLGKDFNFDFLWKRAGYDIPQVLIPYTADSSHMRAAVVGLLNTLLVAVLGCITATIIGVTAGVLRLSNNWLVARLMTIYVELFRNIPLLLWILVVYAVFTESLPAPRAYSGADPAAHMILFDSIALTNRYTAIPTLNLLHSHGSLNIGWGVTINWATIAYIVVLVLAILAHRALGRWARARQNLTGVRPRTWPISAALFVLPLVALWLYFGIEVVRPTLKGFNFAGGVNVHNALVALWLALSLYTGAFIAEIVRAGVLAVSKGQSEASYALGLSRRRTMSLVVLPQALRVIIPPLISQFLNLTKNSSLAIATGYMDLKATLGGTTLNQTGRELESMVLMMGIYLVLSLIISSAMNLFNARVRLRER